MNDSLGRQVAQRLEHLPHHDSDGGLVECSMFHDVIMEIPVLAVLHSVAIHSLYTDFLIVQHNMLMNQSANDLNFSTKIIAHIVFQVEGG